MKKILAIGQAACNVASQLSKMPAYECYYISNEVEKTSKFKFSLTFCEGPEEYEDLDMTKMHKWLSKLKDHCTVIVNGASDSAAVTLRALEKLHADGLKMEIVYFMPETEVLSDTKVLNERTIRGVLQNFTRSGLFEKIYLVSNVELEKLAGPTNVMDYYKQLNHH